MRLLSSKCASLEEFAVSRLLERKTTAIKRVSYQFLRSSRNLQFSHLPHPSPPHPATPTSCCHKHIKTCQDIKIINPCSLTFKKGSHSLAASSGGHVVVLLKKCQTNKEQTIGEKEKRKKKPDSVYILHARCDQCIQPCGIPGQRACVSPPERLNLLF